MKPSQRTRGAVPRWVGIAVLAAMPGPSHAAGPSEPQLYRAAGGAPRVLGSPDASTAGQIGARREEDGARPPARAAEPGRAAEDAVLPQLPPKSADEDPRGSSLLGPASSMVTSLALVLGVFGLVVWGVRRSGASRSGGLPTGAFQMLGRGTLAPRHQAALLRCGDRVLLVGISPSGVRTLAEFTAADEVARLCGACASGPARESFHDALRALGNHGETGGGAGSSGSPASLFSRGA